MVQALDYSAGFPGAQAIQHAGYAGAIRYIGFPEKLKCTTATELADFNAHGLGLALVFEGTLTDWRGGLTAGKANALRARNHANNIGFPRNRPIYMACDQDVVTAVEFNIALDYLRGANASLGGPELTGVYGEADLIDRARNAGVAHWLWQTAAWSRGRRTNAHLYQHVGTAYVGGVGCDMNEINANDWGQHNAQEEDMSWDEKSGVVSPTDPTHEYNMKEMVVGSNQADWKNAATLGRVEAKLDALTHNLSDDEANIIAAVRGQGSPDPAEFAALVAPILGPMIQAGATEAQMRAAVDEGLREAFARAGQ